TSGRQAQTLQAYRTSMREDGAELRLVRRACSRLHLKLRPLSRIQEFVPEVCDLVGAYLGTASVAVAEMGGKVAEKLGDGVMALFGYPAAQENDAERAVRAALSIQRALAELNERNVRSGVSELTARIGIDAGPVVVDAAGEVFGDAPNFAARVQALAEPGTVLITARVQRQTAGLFVAEDRGA